MQSFRFLVFAALLAAGVRAGRKEPSSSPAPAPACADTCCQEHGAEFCEKECGDATCPAHMAESLVDGSDVAKLHRLAPDKSGPDGDSEVSGVDSEEPAGPVADAAATKIQAAWRGKKGRDKAKAARLAAGSMGDEEPPLDSTASVAGGAPLDSMGGDELEGASDGSMSVAPLPAASEGAGGSDDDRAGGPPVASMGSVASMESMGGGGGDEDEEPEQVSVEEEPVAEQEPPAQSVQVQPPQAPAAQPKQATIPAGNTGQSWKVEDGPISVRERAKMFGTQVETSPVPRAGGKAQPKPKVQVPANPTGNRFTKANHPVTPMTTFPGAYNNKK